MSGLIIMEVWYTILTIIALGYGVVSDAPVRGSGAFVAAGLFAIANAILAKSGQRQ